MRAHGALAQLGERRLCKPEVTGSIPVRSTLERPANAGLLLSRRTTRRGLDPGVDPEQPAGSSRSAGRNAQKDVAVRVRRLAVLPASPHVRLKLRQILCDGRWPEVRAVVL